MLLTRLSFLFFNPLMNLLDEVTPNFLERNFLEQNFQGGKYARTDDATPIID